MTELYHPRIEELLRRLSARPHHAYLFTGVQGVGKREAARWFASLLQCEVSALRPCGQCRSCREVALDRHPDTTILADDGENLSIEQVRELQRKLGLSRLSARYRVAVIEEARRLSPPAEASLLKTLEEPPGGVVIILTDSSGELMPTITSRCHRIRFQPLSHTGLVELLRARGAGEEAEEVASLSGGRPALALKMLQDSEVRESASQLAERFGELGSLSLDEAFRLAEDLAGDPDLTARLEGLVYYFRHLLLAERGLAGHVEQKVPFRPGGLVRIVAELEHSLAALRRHASPRLVLEVLLLRMRDEFVDQGSRALR